MGPFPSVSRTSLLGFPLVKIVVGVPHFVWFPLVLVVPLASCGVPFVVVVHLSSVSWIGTGFSREAQSRRLGQILGDPVLVEIHPIGGNSHLKGGVHVHFGFSGKTMLITENEI